MHEAGGRKPRGFGFVTFADVSSVQRVLQSRFHPVDGRGVEVKLAIPREMMSTDDAAVAAAAGGSGEPNKAFGNQLYGEYGYGVPQGEYLPEMSDYPIYGYSPHVLYGYGYMPPMGGPRMGSPQQGIRVLQGTEQYMPPVPPNGTETSTVGFAPPPLPMSALHSGYPPSASPTAASGVGPPPPMAGPMLGYGVAVPSMPPMPPMPMPARAAMGAVSYRRGRTSGYEATSPQAAAPQPGYNVPAAAPPAPMHG